MNHPSHMNLTLTFLLQYATIVLILFSAQVAVVVYGLVKQDEIKEFISSNMNTAFNGYGTSEDTTKALDQTQNSVSHYRDILRKHLKHFIERIKALQHNHKFKKVPAYAKLYNRGLIISARIDHRFYRSKQIGIQIFSN